MKTINLNKKEWLKRFNVEHLIPSREELAILKNPRKLVKERLKEIIEVLKK